MKYYKVPARLLENIVNYLEKTSLPYKDVKAIINDIQTAAELLEPPVIEEKAAEVSS